MKHGEYLQGQITHAAVFSRMLTADEILIHAGLTTPIWLWHRLNPCDCDGDCECEAGR